MATRTASKTVPSGSSVEEFIAGVDNQRMRQDCHRLIDMMRSVSGEEPRLWATMVGFGSYHYKYESGREGDAFLVGFSPRKNELSIYLMGTYFPEQGPTREQLLAKLGKHRMGKACLYVKKLEDIDLGVLEQLAHLSVEGLRQRYPA